MTASGGCSGTSNEAEPEAGAGGDAASGNSAGTRHGGSAGTVSTTAGTGNAAGRGGSAPKGGHGAGPGVAGTGGVAATGGAVGGSAPLAGEAGQAGEGGHGGEAGATVHPEGGATGWSAGLLNAHCSKPLPAAAPDVPRVRTNSVGRPLFDLWRDHDCEDVTWTVCTDQSDCGSGGCLPGTPGGEGVCTYIDVDLHCDGEGEALNYMEGACWICSPTEVHARACCDGIAGFDCRAWPFPANGPPGSVCARHEDCEPGLLCGPGGTYAEGYGICQCPGANVEPPDTCGLL